MKCPKCEKINYAVKKCENCFEPLDVNVASWKKDLQWKGQTSAYVLDPPINIDGMDYANVIISSTFGMTGPKTAIFEATEELEPVFSQVDDLGVPTGLKALKEIEGTTSHREVLPDYEFRLKYPDRADYVE